MTRAAYFSLLLLAGTVTLTAQCPNSTPSGFATGGVVTLTTVKSDEPPQTQTYVVQHSAPLCPVEMHAQQGSRSSLVTVDDDHKFSNPAQHVHLVLSEGRAAQVVGARIRVRGLSGKNRIAEAACGEGITPDRAQTLDVKFTAEDRSGFSTDLMLPGFTSVQSIEILSITYRDGSTWKMESNNACQVTPDPVMRVAGR